MNRKAKSVIILGIIAILFSVLAFVIPFERTPGFWVAYAAEIAAIVLQCLIYQSAFSGNTAKSKFYGMPIARLGNICLGVQTALSLAIFALGSIPAFPTWLSVLLCAIVLALALLGVLGADIARGHVQQIDTQEQTSTDGIITLRSWAATLPPLTSDADLKRQLTSLAEDFRFSDPISNPQTEAMEQELSDMLSVLRERIISGAATTDEVGAVRTKLSQRNVICKSSK